MRKKNMQNNYNNRQRPRYTQVGTGGGGDRGHSGHHGNRPRRNYAAAREKYLSQARDALASGDRVLAENFLQHADHCYRMMAEEGAFRPRENRPQGQPGDDAQPQANAEEPPMPENNSSLPAFLTGGYPQQGEQKPADSASVQNWEERDS